MAVLCNAPGCAGATAEIRFWKQRNALVGGVHEQLGRSQAAAVVEVACTASEDAQLISAFRSSAATLKQVTRLCWAVLPMSLLLGIDSEHTWTFGFAVLSACCASKHAMKLLTPLCMQLHMCGMG